MHGKLHLRSSKVCLLSCQLLGAICIHQIQHSGHPCRGAPLKGLATPPRFEPCYSREKKHWSLGTYYMGLATKVKANSCVHAQMMGSYTSINSCHFSLFVNSPFLCTRMRTNIHVPTTQQRLQTYSPIHISTYKLHKYSITKIKQYRKKKQR